MISLPTLHSTNTEKPVKTAGFAAFDGAFAGILEGKNGTVKQPAGKILPEGGKELPDALPPRALALQAARKALHGPAKAEVKTEAKLGDETAKSETETNDSDQLADSETTEAAPKGTEVIEAIALAIKAPVIQPANDTAKQLPARTLALKGPTLQLALSAAPVTPKSEAPAAETAPGRHAPLHAAQAFLAAMRQPNRTAEQAASARAAPEQANAPEQAIAAAATEAAPVVAQDSARPAKAPRPQMLHEVTLELVKDAKPSIAPGKTAIQSAISSELPAIPAGQPVVADAATPAPAVNPALDVANVQQAVRPHDFATLVDRLVEAREAARPANANLTVMHADFGQVSLHFGHDDGNLTVSLASNDPGFLPAVNAAAASADASANSDTGTQGGRRDDAGQAARSTADNTNTSGGERGASRDGAARHVREGRIRPQPQFAAREGHKPHSGIFA